VHTIDSGYMIEPGVLSTAECDALTDALSDATVQRSRAGAHGLMADTALPLATSFDAPGWGPWSEKAGALHAHAPAWALSRVIALRVHLDASAASNGPLRVVPGSHAAGVLTADGILDYLSRYAAMQCLTPRGGVLAMRPLLIHSSSKIKSADPRRVLHIEYVDSLDLCPGIRSAIV
jgi:hypothetical protein